VKSDQARPAAYVCYLSLIGHAKHNNLYLFTPSPEVTRDFAAIQQHAARKFLKLGKGKVKTFCLLSICLFLYSFFHFFLSFFLFVILIFNFCFFIIFMLFLFLCIFVQIQYIYIRFNSFLIHSSVSDLKYLSTSFLAIYCTFFEIIHCFVYLDSYCAPRSKGARQQQCS